MSKLTSYVRDSVEKNLLERYSAPIEAALNARRLSLAQNLLAEFLGRDAAKFRACPKAWFVSTASLRWKDGKGEHRYVHLDQTMLVPAALATVAAVIESRELNAEQAAIEADAEAANNGRRDLRHKIRAVLYSVTTEKALIAAWPEVADLLPKTVVVANLPAPQVKELNRVLRLPPEKVAAVKAKRRAAA